MDRQERSQILVERARAGDRVAFDRLAQRYRGRVAALLEARLGEVLRRRVAVDDLLQEVFLRAFSSLERFRWTEEEAFFRWLATMVRHVVHEVARREKRELLLPSDEEIQERGVSASRALEREERFERLEAAMERLKPEHREVILLARIRRLPIREVAERMGRSPDAIAQLLRRALSKLRGEFGDTESLGLPDRSLLGEEAPDGQ